MAAGRFTGKIFSLRNFSWMVHPRHLLPERWCSYPSILNFLLSRNISSQSQCPLSLTCLPQRGHIVIGAGISSISK